MSKVEIEKLVFWLVVALAINFVLGPIIGVYLQAYFSNPDYSPPLGLSTAQMVTYSQYLNFSVNLLVNTVIAFSLFNSASSKRSLWFALGLVAKWWALPIYVYYQYIVSNEKKDT
jgi:hypothetical protein